VIPVVVFALTLDPFPALVTAFYIGMYSTMPGFVLALFWFREVFHRRQRAETARMLGLSFQPRVLNKDVQPLLDLPLFYFTRKGRYSAAYQMRGHFDGREVLVMDFAYTSSFPNRINVKVPRMGLQTIAWLEVGPAVPEFHLAPVENDWDDLDPSWPRTLDLGETVLRIDTEPRDPSVVRGHDEESVRRLFSSERIEALGNLGGWTVESQDGWVLIYRHRESLVVEDLPPFIRRVVDIAEVLSRHIAPAAPTDKRGIQTGPSPGTPTDRFSELPGQPRP
jgi:hypothetical protein